MKFYHQKFFSQKEKQVSKTKEWLMSTVDEDYEAMIAAERKTIVEEGRKEMRLEFIRILDNELEWSKGMTDNSEVLLKRLKAKLEAMNHN